MAAENDKEGDCRMPNARPVFGTRAKGEGSSNDASAKLSCKDLKPAREETMILRCMGCSGGLGGNHDSRNLSIFEQKAMVTKIMAPRIGRVESLGQS